MRITPINAVSVTKYKTQRSQTSFSDLLASLTKQAAVR